MRLLFTCSITSCLVSPCSLQIYKARLHDSDNKNQMAFLCAFDCFFSYFKNIMCSVPPAAKCARSLIICLSLVFFQMKSTQVDQGLFTDSYCKVCSAQLISESQRVAHYEVKMHNTSHDAPQYINERSLFWLCLSRDTRLIHTPELCSWHSVNKHTTHTWVFFSF